MIKNGVVEKIVNGGYGILRDEDIGVVFIPYVLPGEEIEYEIVKRKKNYSSGRVKKILKPSGQRITPICPYFSRCGGCSFLNTTYSEELKIKKNIFLDLWRGKFKDVNIIPSPNRYGYRVKVKFQIKDGCAGFFKFNSNDLVEIDGCPLLNEKLNEFLNSLRKCEYRFKGVRDIVAVTNFEDVISHPPVFSNIEKLEMEIGGFYFFLSPLTFFQPNPHVIPELFKILKGFLKKSYNIIEFYAGNGLFSALLSKYTNSLISIESNPGSKWLFYEMVKRNGIGNIKFYLMKESTWIKKFSKGGAHFDGVFLDPPRSGIPPILRDYILKEKFPIIFYLSCDISTQKRDVEFFLKNGFSVESIFLIDFFPATFSIESLFILKRL